VSVSANESQVVQLLSFTTKDIAKAFGIPPIMLGENVGVTYNNLEQLLYGWRTTGLLSVCMIIEMAFEHTFRLQKYDEMVLDIGDLARADVANKADMLKSLVINGIMKPNEARARLYMPPVPGIADELVSQSQIQPMEQSAQIAADANARENDLIDADLAAMSEEEPAPVTPNEEEVKEPVKAKIDMEALDLMLKGVFR
jgi:hypothetical protein